MQSTIIDGGGHMTYQNNISGIYGPIVLYAEDGRNTCGFSVQQQLLMGMGYLMLLLDLIIDNDGDFRFVITIPDVIKSRKGYILIPKPVSFGERP